MAVAEAVAGVLLWIGFSLPFGPPLGILRTALIAVVAWRRRS